MKLHFKLWLIMTLICIAIGEVKGQTIRHKGYVVHFNAKLHCPDSVSWNLTPQMVSCSKVKRIDKFAKDPQNPNSPTPAQFVQYSTDKQNELAKGHLMSYEDAMCDPQENIECFYVDQMYSQYQNMNAGDWKTVEVYEQGLAKKSSLHIVAGFTPNVPKPIQFVLKTGIPVVANMYKAIYCNGKWQYWIIPNLPTSKGHAVNYWSVNKNVFDKKTGLKI